MALLGKSSVLVTSTLTSDSVVSVPNNEYNVVICKGSGDQTVELPLLSNVVLGTIIKVKQSNGNTNEVVVQQNNAETTATPAQTNIIPLDGGAAVDSVTLTGTASESFTLTLQAAKAGTGGAKAWVVLSEVTNEA